MRIVESARRICKSGMCNQGSGINPRSMGFYFKNAYLGVIMYICSAEAILKSNSRCVGFRGKDPDLLPGTSIAG